MVRHFCILHTIRRGNGVNIRRLLVVLSAAVAVRCAADTAWVVHPGSSATQYPLLQTCRNGKRHEFDVEWIARGKYSALRIRDRNSVVFAGINTKGLALIQMAGDPNRDQNPELTPRTHTGGRLLVSIVTRCASAKEAVETVRASVKSGKFFGGCIYLVADTREAHVVECSPQHFSTWQLPHSFCVYANSWKLPGMDDASIADAERAKYLYQKEWIVRRSLLKAMRRPGGITAAASMAASRLNLEESQKMATHNGKGAPLPITAAVGDKYAYGSVLFAIDGDYPAMLSCTYLALGHQRRVIYLPLPLGAADEILKDGAFPTAAANARRATKLEQEFSANFAKAKAAAKERLDRGDEAGAKKLLVDMVKQNLAVLATQATPAGGKQ